MKWIGRSRLTDCAAVLTWAALFSASGGWAGVTSPPSDIAKYDCGTIALHTLLALEGRATHIDTLRTRLPAPSPRGYSMAELRDAAHSFGLALTGVKLSGSGGAPDRPALVFLKRDDHGHFLVVRPVGHSGKLIQIIDSTGDPIVLDAVDLYASPQWTGLALMPLRPNWPLRVAFTMLMIFSSAFLVLLIASRNRAIRASSRGVKPAPAKAGTP
jgi:ABC-type bacteriocin/lantibiotic exporter with double-glycine peptidase domain